jgi:hypothetical protein
VRLPRRRRLPGGILPAFAAFRSVADVVDRASASLAEAVPSTRVVGRPLPDALAEFEALLSEAADAMPAWRRPEIEPAWRRCDAAIETARGLAERLRVEAPPLAGFEGLIGAIAELLAPLEAFDDAARSFDALRTSGDGRRIESDARRMRRRRPSR